MSVTDWKNWTHRFEIGPREREDEKRRDDHDFGTQEFADQEERDRILRQGDGTPEDAA